MSSAITVVVPFTSYPPSSPHTMPKFQLRTSDGCRGIRRTGSTSAPTFAAITNANIMISLVAMAESPTYRPCLCLEGD